MIKEADRVAFRQKIALLIGVGILAGMVYYAFLVPEVADCNNYYNNYYEKKFAEYENYTQDQCVLWKNDLVYTRDDYIRDKKAAWNISNLGPQ